VPHSRMLRSPGPETLYLTLTLKSGWCGVFDGLIVPLGLACGTNQWVGVSECIEFIWWDGGTEGFTKGSAGVVAWLKCDAANGRWELMVQFSFGEPTFGCPLISIPTSKWQQSIGYFESDDFCDPTLTIEVSFDSSFTTLIDYCKFGASDHGPHIYDASITP
jgi:hypothetical protein